MKVILKVDVIRNTRFSQWQTTHWAEVSVWTLSHRTFLFIAKALRTKSLTGGFVEPRTNGFSKLVFGLRAFPVFGILNLLLKKIYLFLKCHAVFLRFQILFTKLMDLPLKVMELTLKFKNITLDFNCSGLINSALK